MEISYKEPRLEFRPVKDDPLTLEYAMAYYPGCFTPTGMRDYHLEDIKKWCAENNCGEFKDVYRITFNSEKELFWFKLRWT